MTVSEVTKIVDVSLLDVPAKLRLLADQVEAGQYGNVDAPCIVTIVGKEDMNVFGFGRDSEPLCMHLILSAATDYVRRNLIDEYIRQEKFK